MTMVTATVTFAIPERADIVGCGVGTDTRLTCFLQNIHFRGPKDVRSLVGEVEVARQDRHLGVGDFESHSLPDGHGSRRARICYGKGVVVVSRTSGVGHLHGHSCHRCHCWVETWVPKCP